MRNSKEMRESRFLKDGTPPTGNPANLVDIQEYAAQALNLLERADIRYHLYAQVQEQLNSIFNLAASEMYKTYNINH